MFDYCFAENGLTAYRQGTRLPAEVTNPHKFAEVDLYPSFGGGKVPRARQFLSPLHSRLETPRQKVLSNPTQS